jgi:hypothetical protein
MEGGVTRDGAKSGAPPPPASPVGASGGSDVDPCPQHPAEFDTAAEARAMARPHATGGSRWQEGMETALLFLSLPSQVFIVLLLEGLNSYR